MSADTKLSIRVEILPDESFLGYLGRVSAHNMLPTTSVLHELIGLTSKGMIQKLTEARRNLPEVSQILGISSETLDRVLPVPVPEDPTTLRIGGLELKEHNYARKYRRVAPGALRLTEHHRSSWLIGDLGYSRETWELLIDHCPLEQCRAPLSWSPRTGIHVCDRCGYDLRKAEPEMIRAEDRPVLQFVADLASEDELYVQRALMQVHPSMRHLNRGVLLQLINLFGRVVTGLQGETDTKKYKNAIGYPSLAVTGGRLLRGYPSSILDIMESCHDAVIPDFFKRLAFAAKAGLSKATAEFVSQMVHDLRPVARSSLKGLAMVRQNQEKLTLREAAEFLKVENASVRRLTKLGLLTPEHVRGAKRQVDWFDREQLQTLSNLMHDRITTETIHGAHLLPLTAIEQLVELKRLRWHPSAAVGIAYCGHCLMESEFRDFKDQLMPHIRPKSDGDRVTLMDCFSLTGPAPKPWGPILDLAMRGALPGGLEQISPNHGFRSSNLTVDIAVASAVATGKVEWVPVAEPDRETCGLMEAEERLGCNPRDITELIKLRLLRRVGNGRPGLWRAGVLEAAKTFISAREIAARLGIQSAAVGPWSRHWRVIRAPGYPLWRRSEVEPFLPPIRYGGGFSAAPPAEPVSSDATDEAEPVRKVA